MKRLENDRLRIQQIMRGVRDRTVRAKLGIMLLITEAESTSAGCLRQGISRQTFYAWLCVLRGSDFDPLSLAEKSRRPKASPRKISDAVELQVVALSKRHGHSDVQLAGEFEDETGIKLAHSTICKILKRRNQVRKYRTPKPNKFTRRYSMANSLDRTQSDTLWTGLTDENEHRVYMAGIIDDCSRRAFGELYDAVSSDMTAEMTRAFFEQVGVPIKSQTDGGSEFTNRYTSLLNPRREKPPTQGAFELLLLEYGVEHRITKPRTPQHNGKIERFNQTVLREFAARVQDGLPLATYRRLFSAYLEYYNGRRRHSSIKYLTPMEAFEKYPPLAA